MADGYYKTVIRTKEDAAPIDNITKFAWDDDDYEQVEEWVEYPEEEIGRKTVEEELSDLKERQEVTESAIQELIIATMGGE